MIQATPSSYGLEVLKKDLKDKIKEFVIFGDKNPKNEILDKKIHTQTSYEDIKDYIFKRGLIDVGYFDKEGILTYEINLKNIITEKYSYGIMIIDDNQKSIATIKLPKVIFYEGIGAEVIIKLPVMGEKNEVVITHNEYVLRAEFESFKQGDKNINYEELAQKTAPYIINQDKLKQQLKNLFTLSLLAKDKVKKERESLEKIGEHKYSIKALNKDYVKLGEILNAKDHLLLWFFFGAKMRFFNIGKSGVYAKGGNRFAYQEQALPDLDLITIANYYSFTHQPGSSRQTVVGSISKENLSDYHKVFKGESVEVNANIYHEGIYRGIF
ncbi:hypothetical protein LW135_06710 [Helicobacter sp. faydin-H20]|uniref:hypothetical protein n=1 Tax=Helicobacter anatolicus TaxID=2905874 RepID=UPI001E2E9310|nr:hypothetical protein [Helicobacter anatolicus]MCE3037510.1 hypothetical protein [Helicobacter anatolicus]